MVAPGSMDEYPNFNARSMVISAESGESWCRVSVLARSVLADAIMNRSHPSSQGVDDQGVALGQHRAVLYGLDYDRHVVRQVQVGLPGEVEEQVEVRDALGVGLAGGLLQVRPQLRRTCAFSASETQSVIPLCSNVPLCS